MSTEQLRTTTFIGGIKKIEIYPVIISIFVKHKFISDKLLIYNS